MATRDALVLKVRDRLARASSPRITILIILTLAGGAAFLTSFAGLAAGLDSMAVRYALASIAGYLAFVVLIRGWIAIHRGWHRDGDPGIGSDPTDMVDLVDLATRGAGRGARTVKEFAGGTSGGGGGGGSAWIAEPLERAASSDPRFVKPFVSPKVRGGSSSASSSSSSSSSSSVASEAVEEIGGMLDFDEGVFVVIAIVAALGGAVCIAYVIYIAPLLLAEVALDAALVSAAYRRLRKQDVGHWTGAVFRRTWVPATILVVFMFVAGFAAQKIAPGARSIGGVVRALVS